MDSTDNNAMCGGMGAGEETPEERAKAIVADIGKQIPPGLAYAVVRAPLSDDKRFGAAQYFRDD